MLKDCSLEYVADQADRNAMAEEIEERSADIGKKIRTRRTG